MSTCMFLGAAIFVSNSTKNTNKKTNHENHDSSAAEEFSPSIQLATTAVINICIIYNTHFLLCII